MDEFKGADYWLKKAGLKEGWAQPPVHPEWEALTQDERDTLLEGAHGNFIYENDSTSSLEERGYIFDNTPEFSDDVYHLTYAGAIIIPPHLVKGTKS